MTPAPSDGQPGAGASGQPGGQPVTLQRLLTLRQYQQNGLRAPHKPLLVMLVLTRLLTTGTSALTWLEARRELAALIVEFGPTSKTSPTQAAAYPFTHLRSDGFWTLSPDVPMDRVTPLEELAVVGRLEERLQAWLLAHPHLALQAVHELAATNFAPTVVPDVLAALGLDPDTLDLPTGADELGAASGQDGKVGPGSLGGMNEGATTLLADDARRSPTDRKRSAAWRHQVLQAWDRACAFCGYDGQLLSTPVGLEAAHIRWFQFSGPDAPDNGLALCSLHHKLFDRGVLGLTLDLRVQVSAAFTARSPAARRLYDLHQQTLPSGRPGRIEPAAEHLQWHHRQIFKAPALP